MSDKQWYPEYQAELSAEQAAKPAAQVKAELSDNQPKTVHSFDMNNAPKQLHRWVDRGEKMSCEGAAHPMHQAYKRR